MKYIYTFLLTLFVHQALYSQVISPDQSNYCSEHDEHSPTEPVLLKLSEASLTSQSTAEDNAIKSTGSAGLKAISTINLHPHIPNGFKPDRGKIVGEIPISGSITPSGAQSYTIPISVEPGANGVQPNVSIVYNSQGADGVLGKGWSIGGISA
ncbi:MAG: hypothetical protein MI866_02510, partial [Bacteroidales bacterium]|nr:hypothetical protein [Bacteroidales bacterium]